MKSLCRISILFITLFHLFGIFFNLNQIPLDVFTMILLVCGIPMQKKGFRTITLAFLALGSIILLAFRMPLDIWTRSFTSMTNIIAIIVVMQLFTIPIEVGKYSMSVEYWLKRLFKKESSLYFFSMLVTNMFSSFLLFGTVPVMVSLFTKALKNSVTDYQRFLSSAILRGYSLVLFWAPGAIIMLLVMQVTKVTWSSLFVPGIILSFIGIVTSYVYEHFLRMNKHIKSGFENPEININSKKAAFQSIHILLVVLGLLFMVSVLEKHGIGEGSGKILLAGLITACIWILGYAKRTELKSYAADFFRDGITHSTDFAVFFIAVGLFAGAVDHSGLLTMLQPVLQSGVNHLGIFSVIIIPVVFITLAVFGIHPMILVVILGKVLLAVSLPLPIVSIGLILILSASISFIVSPFAGMAIMTSKMLDAEPMDVAFRWNIGFCVIFLMEGLVFACLWR